MINIQIVEHINGYSVTGFDWKSGHKFIDEINEEYLNALRAIKDWAHKEIEKELDRRNLKCY